MQRLHPNDIGASPARLQGLEANIQHLSKVYTNSVRIYIMSGLKDLTNVWQSIKEMDLRPIREDALQEVNIVMVSRPGGAKQTLLDQMRRDPNRKGMETLSPVTCLDYYGDDSVLQKDLQADLMILLVDESLSDAVLEQRLAKHWADSGRRILIVLYQEEDFPLSSEAGRLAGWAEWGKSRLLRGCLTDEKFLLQKFVPAVLDILPHKQLALGRQFPLFRVAICRQLISESCFSNAAYAFSTGLAEVVPALDIPLNVADMFVLSKNQAFLVYRLGLTLGLSTHWQDYITEFGGILGGGFFWRQVARQLVGLIPAWGIIPKVAVSYAGTYVVGHVVLQWYLTGKQLSAQQIRALYAEAFRHGKVFAAQLAKKLPKPKIGRRKVKELPVPEKPAKICPNCSRTSAGDAVYCQYCGSALE